MVKKVQIAIAIIIGLTPLFGVGYKLDCRWAKPSMTDYTLLVQNVKGIKVTNTVQAMWQIENRYLGRSIGEWSEYDRERYRRLKLYLECLESEKKSCEMPL